MTQCMLSDHKRIRLEINNRNMTGKSDNMQRLKNTQKGEKEILR